jgi:HD-like signal output (HDOD) protein
MASLAVDSKLDLDQLLATAQLPALPQSAIRVLEISRDPNNGPPEFARPIESDPGLASQVLRFVNSSYFGFSREVSSVKLALALVGVRTIKNFTLWSAIFSLLPNPRSGVLDLRSLWQDSLRRGTFARLAAKRLGVQESDEAFAAALLQDMAVPLLSKEFPQTYDELLGARAGGQERLSALEQQRIGWTHAMAGAKLARHWNLPEELAGPIEHHCDLESLLAGDRKHPVCLAVALSAYLPPVVDPEWPEFEQFAEYYQQVLGTDGDLLDALAEVDHDFEQFAPVLNLPTTSSTLVSRARAASELANERAS